MITKTVSAALCVLMSVAFVASAAPEEKEPAVTLKVGDAAPPLAVDKWLKGGPIDKLAPGKIYVIECWATWCGPCIAAMPHVTKLQAKYKDKDVVVIGVDVWERDENAAEPFVKKMGDKMGYAVVKDDTSDGPQAGKMATTWLKAAGRNGIPCSFLVDKQGKIAWIGHPMMMERPLGLLVEGKFDPAEEEKFTKKLDGLFAQYGAAMKAKDYDKAATTLDQVAVMNPTSASQYRAMKVQVLVQKKDYAGANALAAELAETVGADDANLAISLASALLSVPDADQVNAELAVKLATKAYEANGKEGWQYQMFLARAHAANRAYDKAAEWQTKAIEGAPQQVKKQLEKELEKYKKKAAGNGPAAAEEAPAEPKKEKAPAGK